MTYNPTKHMSLSVTWVKEEGGVRLGPRRGRDEESTWRETGDRGPLFFTLEDIVILLSSLLFPFFTLISSLLIRLR